MGVESKSVGIGLIGYKHWGPYHARVFDQLPQGRLKAIADLDPRCMDEVKHKYPGAETSTDYNAVLNHPEVEAVVISTPTNTHFSLVRAALLAGKDVLVEKPICHTGAEAGQLIEMADSSNRILMCAHIFIYNNVIQKLREYLADGTLGRVYYMAATRTSLDPHRRDINVLYDLGSDDVSIFQYLLGGPPLAVSAWGECYLHPDSEDTAFARLEFPNKTLCHMHLSWLNPRKERTLVIVGANKMIVWDDAATSESVKLYDKGVDQQPDYDSFGQFQLALRDADVLIPRIKVEEPLKQQDQHFLECVIERRRPLTDGSFSRAVVTTVESLQRSLRKGGIRQAVESPIRQ